MINNDQHHLFNKRLRSDLRPTRLSENQRKRHLDVLMNLKDENDMEFLRRRSLAEISLVVAALVIVFGGIATWQFMKDGSDNDSNDLVAAAGATLTARTGQASSDSTVTTENVSSTCPVTPYNPDPPVRFQTAAPQQMPYWYGNDDGNLWAAPNTLYGSAEVSPDSPGLWFEGQIQFLVWGQVDQGLEVSGHPIDGSDGAIEVLDTISLQIPLKNQVTRLAIPHPGCWEIIGHVDDRELRIVTDVRPHAERPDVLRVRNLRDAVNQRYPIPESCSVAAWVGPVDSVLGLFTGAAYRIEGSQFTAFNPTGILIAGGDGSQPVWWVDVDSPIAITGELIDDPSVAVSTVPQAADDSGFVILDLKFPVSGCWKLSVSSDEHSEEFVVYVRPAEALKLVDPT